MSDIKNKIHETEVNLATGQSKLEKNREEYLRLKDTLQFDMETYKVTQKEKILLVNPPFYRFIGFSYEYNPMGTAYIGACLRREGYQCDLTNFDFPEKINPHEPDMLPFAEDYGRQYKEEMNRIDHPIWKEVENKFQKYRPDIIGITSMTPQIEQALYTAKIAKKVNPKCKVIIGGVHATVLAEECIADENVDFVSIGEGEIAAVELCKMISRELNHQEFDYSQCKSTAWKDKTGKIIFNPRGDFIENLDLLPYPIRDYEKKSEKDFMISRVSILSGRGCPFKCTFCARKPMWGNSVRLRSPESVADEIEFVYHKYGCRFVMFEDDTFTMNGQRVKETLELIQKRGLKITYTIQTRVTHVNENLVKLVKETGCKNIAIGVESGNQWILDKIEKGITLEQVRTAVKLIQSYGILVSSFFIIGYPWETKEMLNDTENFIKELGSDITHLYMLVPLPGSKLYDDAVAEKRLIPKEWFYYFFQNPNVVKHDHFDNAWFYQRYQEMKNYIHTLRRDVLKKKSRSFRFILTKIKDHAKSPKRLWYFAKRFVKIQLGLVDK